MRLRSVVKRGWKIQLPGVSSLAGLVWVCLLGACDAKKAEVPSLPSLAKVDRCRHGGPHCLDQFQAPYLCVRDSALSV